VSVTATTLITAAYTDIGVLGQGETLSAYLAQDGLRRLNAMIASWRAHQLTVLAIERMIFPLVANKQTYTIGLGGDFNVPRPTRIDAAGLWLQGLGAAVSVTSITASGSTATVTQTAHGHTVGAEVFVDGAAQIGYNGLQIVESIPTANTWTYTLQETVTSPATGTIVAYPEGNQPVEIPRGLYTVQSYQATQIKTLPNSLFTGVYYIPGSAPFGTIVLWPVPNTAQNQLVLYLPQVFGGFADLTTAYGYPDTPGYQEALEYNLAVRLAAPSAIPLAQIPTVIQLARESFGTIKRQNYQITDLPTDPALVLTGDRRSGYNINTGTGAGAGGGS
jgi:hypothetical protein